MSLKVFDLQCEQGHVFEGWFGSSDAFEAQTKQQLIACPICESRAVSKKLSASRINTGHARVPAAPRTGEPQPVVSPAAPQLAELQAAFLRHLRKIVRETDNVGPQFAQEARRMHYGEIEERAIRGTATADERDSLLDDGIAVMPIPGLLDDDRLN